MITELEKIKKDMERAMDKIDNLIAGHSEELEDVPVSEMIDFCLQKEKESTFNADFAFKMQRALEKYKSLTSGQHHGLKKHYLLAKSWR